MSNDLTLEEMKVLSSLENPDKGDNQEQYHWDEELQREIIGLLLNDKQFVIQSVDLIKPIYFGNECHKLLSKIVLNHYKTYNQIPNKIQLTSELKTLIEKKDDEIKVFFLGELNTVYQYYLPGIESRDYYLDKITNFAKGQSIKHAMSECLDMYKRHPEDDATYVKIEEILRKALLVDRNVEIGLDYFATYEERYARMLQKKESGDYFITGFPSIDDSFAGGGFSRGEICSIVGLPGTGKSIFLVNAALANLHRGKKFLYISLEIDSDKCAERFDAQFANPNPFGDEDTGISTKNLYENKESVFEAIQTYVSDKEDKRLFIIKQFPAGQMSMADFRAYYSQVVSNGFVPDLIVLDYVGEMEDYPGMATWESRQKIVRDLRGFAVENQFGILTAMQPDGRSREVVKLGSVIDDDNLADSKGQNRPLDALWSINQLQEEQQCSLARIFNIKTRDGKSRYTTWIQFDYKTLKMREISENKYKKIFNDYKNQKTETITEKMAKENKVNEIIGKTKPFSYDVGYNNVEDGIEND